MTTYFVNRKTLDGLEIELWAHGAVSPQPLIPQRNSLISS